MKIADFGVSAEFEGLDAFLTGTAGTPAFMAPEALVGQTSLLFATLPQLLLSLPEDSAHFYSGRAQDIWSLGVTLFAFLYGRVPFWDPYIIALHRKIKTQALEFPPTYPILLRLVLRVSLSPFNLRPTTSDEVKALIGKMLTKDPGFRLVLTEIKVRARVVRSDREW